MQRFLTSTALNLVSLFQSLFMILFLLQKCAVSSTKETAANFTISESFYAGCVILCHQLFSFSVSSIVNLGKLRLTWFCEIFRAFSPQFVPCRYNQDLGTKAFQRATASVTHWLSLSLFILKLFLSMFRLLNTPFLT